MSPDPRPNKSVPVAAIAPGTSAKAIAFSQIAFTLGGAALPPLLAGASCLLALGELPLGVPGGVLCFFGAGVSLPGVLRCWPCTRISTSSLCDGIGGSAGSEGSDSNVGRGGRKASAMASESAASKDLRMPWSGFALLSIARCVEGTIP